MEFLVHNYFPAPAKPFVLNIASPDEANRIESVAFACRAIDLAASVGAPFYSIHAGFAAALQPAMLGKPEAQSQFMAGKAVQRERAMQTMRETVRELADIAARSGIRLLLENNVVTPGQFRSPDENPLLLVRPEETRDFLDSVGHSNVGLLLDVAHAKVSANALGFAPESFFDLCGDRIAAVHLSDNDGARDTNRPFTRESWFFGRLRDFRHCPWVIEVYRMPADVMARQIVLAEAAKAQ
jgi:sugar phosphate isomerase/epimerase